MIDITFKHQRERLDAGKPPMEETDFPRELHWPLAQSIFRIIEHHWRADRDDFMACDWEQQQGHVFNAMFAVHSWLTLPEPYQKTSRAPDSRAANALDIGRGNALNTTVCNHTLKKEDADE